jgi:hypothetical protein
METSTTEDKEQTIEKDPGSISSTTSSATASSHSLKIDVSEEDDKKAKENSAKNHVEKKHTAENSNQATSKASDETI